MFDSMNFSLLSVGIIVAAGTIFGFVVFFNNRQSATTKAFLFLSLITGLWGMVNYAACNVASISSAIFLTRAVMFLAVWQAYALFRFFYIFPRPTYNLPKTAGVPILIVCIVVSALTFTNFIFANIVNFIPNTPPTTVVGPLMPLFGLTAIGLVLSGLLVFFGRTIKTERQNRLPFIIIWTGGTITFFLIIVFSFIYPAWLNRSDFVPLGAIFTFPLITATGYAIVKHRLLNIRIIGTEFITLALALTILLEVLLTDTLPLIIFRFSLFILVLIFGVSLIKGTIKEVEQREKLQKLSGELQTANTRLKELDQQKTDFLSIASHQLRTPLSIFKGYIELLSDGAYGKIGVEPKRILHDFDINNEHLIKLVDEFLNVSRIEQGRIKWDFKPADIGQLIGEVVHELKEKATGKKMALVWHDNAEPMNVTMDREKIYHTLFNFVDNAVKYSDDDEVIVSLESKDGGVEVRIKDHGIGFDKIDEASFFTKFYRGQNTKNTNNVVGTGLGIYICKKFVEGHGGRVWAKSPGPGKGSEFGFWLPLVARPTKEQMVASQSKINVI
ncbi:MAG: ATP-binding protein [Candidatus Magasanikbacteria bacterium]